MPRIGLSRLVRASIVSAALAASLSLSGCGFDVQTLQPYTPAHGVNADVTGVVKVRNLLVIANASGKGRLSAALVAPAKDDTLSSVTGTALKTDGTPAGELTVTAQPIALPGGRMVVLTGDGAPVVTVAGADLAPGHNVALKLTFASGTVIDIVTPVVDAATDIYKTAAPELA